MHYKFKFRQSLPFLIWHLNELGANTHRCKFYWPLRMLALVTNPQPLKLQTCTKAASDFSLRLKFARFL
jgi:hypothetical protein